MSDRLLLNTQGGPANVDVDLGQLSLGGRIACTAGQPPVLSTFNIAKVPARLDFATSESVFRCWRRIFKGARIRNLTRSCVAASRSYLSAGGHRRTLCFPSAAAPPSSCTPLWPRGWSREPGTSLSQRSEGMWFWTTLQVLLFVGLNLVLMTYIVHALSARMPE